MPRLDYLAITDYIEEKLLAYKHVPTIDDPFGSEEEFYEATKGVARRPQGWRFLINSALLHLICVAILPWDADGPDDLSGLGGELGLGGDDTTGDAEVDEFLSWFWLTHPTDQDGHTIPATAIGPNFSPNPLCCSVST